MKKKTIMFRLVGIFSLVLLITSVIAHFGAPNNDVDTGLNITAVQIVGKQGLSAGPGGNLSRINISGTMTFNVSMNLSNGTAGSPWNITNVTLMFTHPNGSIVGNFSTNNVSNNQRFFNISAVTTSLPDGYYRLQVMISNYTGAQAATAAALQPRVNTTAAINISVDNSAPNVTVNDTNTIQSRNFTGGNGLNNHSFNVTAVDSTFWALNLFNGTNLQNVTFSFDNASGTGFNATATNATAINRSNAVWQVFYNASGLHAGTHTVRIFAYNYNGKLNDSSTFNFTVNTPHNVTNGGGNGFVTHFANFSARNTTIMFNISVRNGSNRTSGMPNAPITNVIFMFDNASGNDFNLSNGSNVFAGQYWNLSFNVSNLVEGNNTVTIFVNDTLGNFNKTEFISFNVDKTAPSITVSCTPSSAAVGDTVTCTCSSNDNSGGVGITTGPIFLGGTNTEDILATTEGTITSSTCASVDGVANRQTATGTFTVSEAETTGSGVSDSSGSGGSSGGSSAGAAATGAGGTTADKAATEGRTPSAAPGGQEEPIPGASAGEAEGAEAVTRGGSALGWVIAVLVLIGLVVAYVVWNKRK
ncbi:MAG TPA: Ig-like domain-containing protein [Candidatus Nanoarchaeia archaeon]|nr:Ig-like domain-containing protein [Candidatus Nanoarchaeia archaeon]